MATTLPSSSDDKRHTLPDDKHTMSPQHRPSSDEDAPSLRKGEDILGQESTDPVLNAKMHLVNDAIDEIGMTGYQWKLFVLNGFGYAVDSLMLLIQSIIATYAAYEFQPSFAYVYPQAMLAASTGSSA